MKWSIEKRVLGCFVSVALIVALLMVAAWRNAGQSIVAAKWIAHTHEVLAALADIKYHILTAETSNRDYLLPGTESFLSLRDNSPGMLDGHLGLLARLVADNPTQLLSLAALRVLLDSRGAEFDQLQKIDQAGAPYAVRKYYAKSLSFNAQISDSLERIIKEENRLFRQRQAGQVAQWSATRIIFGLLLLSLIVMLPLVFLSIRRNNRLRDQPDLLTSLPLRDCRGLVSDGIGLLHDIAGKKLLSDELRIRNDEITEKDVEQGSSKAFLGSILNAVAVPIFVKNRQHEFILVNDAFAELVGRPKEEFIGRTDSVFFPAAECRVFREKDEELFASRLENSNEEDLTNAQGRVKSIVTKKTICSDPDDCDILVGVINDISARKQMERELQLRIDEIAHKNGQLEEASRIKSEFLASMSHELRTPLNAIIGFSELLKDGLLGALSGEQVARIIDIFDSGDHLLSLINDILDLSKVEAGKMTLDLAPIELAELLDNSLAMIKVPAAEQMVQVTVDCADDIGLFFADPRKVRQIVYNLLSNAVKFSNRGRIRVHAGRVARAAVGRLSGRWPGRCFPLAESEFSTFIEISVSDCGIGMTSAAQDLLFLPFSQVDSGLARKFAGTGLGLAMVKRLAELHGGTVAVESAEGIGSRLFVWLPLRPVDARHGAGISLGEPRPPALPDQRFALVVEDNDQSAELIRLQLESEGLTVLRARSAEVALQIAAQQPLALITLDILLPGIDGWAFLERIKQVPGLQQVPVVIISILECSNRGIALGAARIFEKPLRHDELHRALVQLGLHAGNGRQRTVLVADDDPSAVELLALFLRSHDYAVLTASGGSEAIELARRHLPDLIVLDLMMPAVSGFEVVEALKSHASTALIPLLVVTAKDLAAEELLALNGHVSQIVAKSQFNRGRFLGEVRRALAAHDRISTGA